MAGDSQARAGAYRYESFSLRIETEPEGTTFRTTATSFLTGEDRDRCRINPTWKEVAKMRRHLPLGNLREVRIGSDQQPAEPPEKLGRELFEELFAGNVLRSYDTNRGAVLTASADEQRRQGLRIQLHFDPRQPRLLELSSIPWELLWDPKDQQFLSLDLKTPVVRYLELPAPSDSGVYRPPLRRILVVLTSPKGLPPLNVKREAELIEEAWKYQYGVELTLMPRARLQELQERVGVTEFEIVHFVGHGTHDRETGESFVFFEGNDGQPDPVSGRRLAAMLQAVKQPRLVFLNACQTGRPAETGGGLDPLAGVAVGLLMEGIPAVLAMQTPISDKAAVKLSQEVYRHLSRGCSLEEAVTHGRLLLRDQFPKGQEWATPVLFLRTMDGHLFQLPASREPPSVTRRVGSAAPHESEMVSEVPIPLARRRVIVDTEEPKIVVTEEPRADDGPVAPTEPKKLQVLQKDIYSFLGDIGLDPVVGYDNLNPEEKLFVQSEIIKRMAGLSVPADQLLEIDHVNLRFQAKALLNERSFGRGFDELHRKSAIYSSHSIALIPSVRIPDDPKAIDFDKSGIGKEHIRLLVEHRPLVEEGKMTLVPSQVLERRHEMEAIFSVEELQTIEVNMHEQWARRHFSKSGQAFEPRGTLILKPPHARGLQLGDVLDIENQFQKEYHEFHVRFRNILEKIHPGCEGWDTYALKTALMEVDEGIQYLDAQYDSIRKRGMEESSPADSGAVAVTVYGPRGEDLDALEAALRDSSVSACIEYFKTPNAVPREIRESPFFIPWLIHHRGG